MVREKIKSTFNNGGEPGDGSLNEKIRNFMSLNNYHDGKKVRKVMVEYEGDYRKLTRPLTILDIYSKNNFDAEVELRTYLDEEGMN